MPLRTRYTVTRGMLRSKLRVSRYIVVEAVFCSELAAAEMASILAQWFLLYVEWRNSYKRLIVIDFAEHGLRSLIDEKTILADRYHPECMLTEIWVLNEMTLRMLVAIATPPS